LKVKDVPNREREKTNMNKIFEDFEKVFIHGLKDPMTHNSCETRVMIKTQLDKLGEQLEREGGRLYIQTYYDLKMYDTLLKYMPAYDIIFMQNKGIPFLKEHNPITLLFLDLVILFYSLVIYDLLENKVIVVDANLIDHLNSTDVEPINIFDYCWSWLDGVTNLGEHERMIYPYGYEVYISDDQYLIIEKTIVQNFIDSYFEKALERVLGIYRTRFSYVMYSQKYQPMFIRVANDYKNSMSSD